MWEELISSSEENDSPKWKTLLDKFHKLEQFINAPIYHPLVGTMENLSKEDAIPPKMYKIDELIKESLNNKSKVLVAFHHRISAKQCYEHSKYKDISSYYESGCKQSLNDFAKISSHFFSFICFIVCGVVFQFL